MASWELRSVRYFLAVADTGSVTAAAQRLHITQPSLSRQIRAFERELGLRLFDRRDRRLVLSAGGRQFLPVARDLVARADLAVKAAETIAGGTMSSITLSATGTTTTDVVAPFLATWSRDDPVPKVQEERPARIYGSLERGADLAVGTEPPPRHLASRPVAVLPVWAYVPPPHPWAGRTRVPLLDLLEQDLLLLGIDQHARRALDNAVGSAQLGYRSVTEFDTPQVAQAVAAAGRGVAVVSDDPRFGLHPVEVGAGRDRVTIRLYAAWSPEHHAAALIRRLADRLSAFCVQRYGPRAGRFD
jgi:DNA-binding transcriptional LysR family regulator